MIRQGDILFIPVAEANTQYMTKVEDGVIAAGESTGHNHRVAEEDLAKVELFRTWRGVDGTIIRTLDAVKIVHDEHHPVYLPGGATFLIHQAREYDYFNNLTVAVRD